MRQSVRFTSADLELFPDDGKRYEIIHGELYVSPQPSWEHQGEVRNLHAAPELIIEGLSPGAANERRDRDAKLKLYSRRGVQEYWSVSWLARQVEVYRREDLRLRHVATLTERDRLTSPLLPGFTLPAAELFTALARL